MPVLPGTYLLVRLQFGELGPNILSRAYSVSIPYVLASAS